LCRDLLRSAAPTLVELKLGLRNCIMANDYDEEYTMCTLDKLLYESDLPGAEFLDLPKVERLEFYAGNIHISYTVITHSSSQASRRLHKKARLHLHPTPQPPPHSQASSPP
jgi:hypothetical protein